MKNVFDPKEYRPLLWYTNQSLLLTNLFVFVYKISLKMLNRLFPFPVDPNFYLKRLLAPEPFEIPLYIILSVIWVAIIFFFSRYHKRFEKIKFGIWNVLIFPFLLLIFLINIGIYPLKDGGNFINFILAGYLIVIVTVTVLVYSLRKRPILVFFLLIASIALLTLEPRLPSNAHDLSFFFGPIYEVSRDKTIFTTTSSIYGFASILILSLFTHLRIFNPFYLPLLTWILYIFQYLLCFYILSKAGRSYVYASIGLFSIVTINYFSLFHLPNTIPQIGPMRWLPLIISLFLVQRSKNTTDSKLIFLLSLLSIWNIEAGMAILLSFSFTLLILSLVGLINRRKIALSLGFYLACILASFIILNIIHLALGRQAIDFLGAFSRLREFAIAGLFMIPMPWHTHLWLVLLVYFASIIYFKKQKIEDRKSSILLFSANLSLFASIYYIGRSHPHNLFHISIFFLLNAFLLISQFKNRFSSPISYALSLIFLFLIFILYPGYNRKQALATMIKTKFDNLKNGPIFKPELEEEIKRYYSLESLLIKKNLPEKEILILSVDDTYIFYLVNKTNLLLDNPQSGIVSKKEMNFALRKALKICPQKIAASCKLFSLCRSYQTFNHEAFNIQKELLESLEKGCGIEYRPQTCTNKLCIAIKYKNQH